MKKTRSATAAATSGPKVKVGVKVSKAARLAAMRAPHPGQAGRTPRLLALDAAYGSTGWAVTGPRRGELVASGVVAFDGAHPWRSGQTFDPRPAAVWRWLNSIALEYQLELVVIEHFPVHAKTTTTQTAGSLGGFLHVVEAWCGVRLLPCWPVPQFDDPDLGYGWRDWHRVKGQKIEDYKEHAIRRARSLYPSAFVDMPMKSEAERKRAGDRAEAILIGVGAQARMHLCPFELPLTAG